MIFEALIAKKMSFASQLGQRDPIVMKLKLDMSSHLLNAYTKFWIDIWKHVEKSLENADGRTGRRTDECLRG